VRAVDPVVVVTVALLLFALLGVAGDVYGLSRV